MMAKSLWQQSALAAVGIALLGTLAGCSSAGPAAAVTVPTKAVAQAPVVNGFLDSSKVDDVNVTLGIQPMKPGVTNHLVVTFDQKDIKAAEAQVVMATMGHGQVVDLTQTAPGKFEADTDALPMDGSWLFRIEFTTAADTTKAALFHALIKQ